MKSFLPEFILASTSTIRKKILDQAGLTYICKKPVSEEPRANKEISTIDYVKICAQQKAREISNTTPEHLICGCDQSVAFQSQTLNKVANLEECIERLITFSGKSHQLVNGLSIFKNGRELFYHTEIVNISFRNISKEQIIEYVRDEKPLSSVACYYLEGKGIQLIKNIEGNFFTALGLPLFALLDFLNDYQQEKNYF